MWPFYNINTQLFGINPFFGFPFAGRRRARIKTLSGIPVLSTTGVTATTTAVRYDINLCEFRSLPCEGLFFLDVKQSSDTAAATLPVGFSNGESTTAEPALINALSVPVQAGDLQLNVRYLIYYNKRNNVYQLVNAYPANITA